MQKLICKSKNGVEVFYDTLHSHASTHLKDTPNLMDVVTEVICEIELNGEEISNHFDMKRIIGSCDVVETDASDEIVYAMRKNHEDDGLVPFTKSQSGPKCTYVALHLIPNANGSYQLSSAWIGKFDVDDEPFPQSHNATKNSKSYWNNHAFVWGSQEIILGSYTTIKPW